MDQDVSWVRFSSPGYVWDNHDRDLLGRVYIDTVALGQSATSALEEGLVIENQSFGGALLAEGFTGVDGMLG